MVVEKIKLGFTDEVSGIPVNMDPVTVRLGAPDGRVVSVPRNEPREVKNVDLRIVQGLERDGWDVEGDFPSAFGQALEDFKVKELKSMAKGMEIEGYSTMTKDELIAAIKEA